MQHMIVAVRAGLIDPPVTCRPTPPVPPVPPAPITSDGPTGRTPLLQTAPTTFSLKDPQPA